MALQRVATPPKEEDFTPLQEHQEQTPSTFFGSKPVLYAHYSSLTLAIPTAKLQSDETISRFSSSPDEQASPEDSLVRNVEIWVTSQDLILFQYEPVQCGVSIPYPKIALHATMKYKSQIEALYMELCLSDMEIINDEDDILMLGVTILPPDFASNPETSCIQNIFTAMNTCADLHPDPDDSDAEEPDETAPGASGWITADNMDEYLNEDGTFKGVVYGESTENEQLGPGAGTVRSREDAEEQGSDGVNGTQGETKWQRTG
ncbi:hypothetical protein M011DRAFT_459571 [Sporormia fimetaria CBS 119925]|uniref:Benzoylformate decarboxylase n=1 Tax=Sporormia fimetaria CBS 119925 TaxID=1340428 RepID=A0A6A6V833_9PLEO|nr:hypothetical protein M011DRAFT_459571 [Sporormia fimetaria CBS 119925]